MDSANTTPRVPAWKRIGLKLKYAKDTADENTPPTTSRTEESSKLAKRPAENEEPETPAKRAKSSKSEKKDQKKTDISTSLPASNGETRTPNRMVLDDEGGNNDRPSMRKSVSFTPDTKAEDGFSASNFFKAWVNGGDGDSNTEQEETASPSKDPGEAKKEKKKKVKKSKSTLIQDESTTTTKASTKESPKSNSKSKCKKREEEKETPPYITYLTTYHTSRATWKFSKNHQASLLKNLFNIYRIPPPHTPALIEYISGLQGSARQRVAREAADVLKGVAGIDAGAQSDLETCAKVLREKMEEYDNTAGEGEAVEELRRTVEKGRRAESILTDALRGESRSAFAKPIVISGEEKEKRKPESGNTTPAMAVAMAPKTATKITFSDEDEDDAKPAAPSEKKTSARKKRKARTDVSSSSSSSESSSSESESDSESDSDSD